MITVKPMQDRDEEKQLLAGVPGAEENARILIMKDGDETLGWATAEIKEQALVILKLTAGAYDCTHKPGMEEVFVLDTLLRAAASYGANNGCDRIETAFPDFYDFFKLRGFSTDTAHAFTDMSTIVHYG